MERHQARHTPRARLLGGGILVASLLSATAVALHWQKPVDTAADEPVVITPDRDTASLPVQTSSPDRGARSVAAKQSPLAEKLVGGWQLQRHGERTLRVNADGTATAEVQLNMVGALLYGQRMKLELKWTLEGDVMTQTIVSGTPAESVKSLIRDWGDRRTYRVVDVNSEQLVLSEVGDDGDRDVWTSVDRTPLSTASQTQQSPR